MIKLHINVLCNNILTKFAIQNFKSKDTSAILRKNCQGSSAFLRTNFDIILHRYDNIWDKYAFKSCRSKIRATNAILRGKIVMITAFFVN